MTGPRDTATIAAERARWQHVKQLLAEAIARPHADRAAFLDTACGGAPEIRNEIDALLASYQTAGNFLEEPAGFLRDAAVATVAEGYRIGPYRILRELGRGGMSVVHLAERADEAFHKQVAIKVVPGGLYSAFAVQRFGAERQILAELDHPNIARLLDGGTTGDGMPYLVMELVDGTPVDVYCDRALLPIEARLDLFRQICAAVEYAHQHLVVHRDLKPTNILVTKDGVPKLLDFGIAKILDADARGVGAEVTMTGMAMLTPRFASPEQVRGQPITTACDVYALGVLLHELLTGRSPYRVASDLPHELARAICEDEPQRPSLAAAPDVARRLAGDLDTVVLKALNKDPAARYGSVAHFADDLRRHAAGLPVTARKETAAYRARKFVARHRIGVAAIVALVLSLAAGLGATLVQTRAAQRERGRAERRFEDARALVNTLLFDVEGAIQTLPGATPARNLLITRGLAYLDKLSRDVAAQPDLEHDIAVAYRKLGDVQGNPYYAHIGDAEGAVASYRKALAIHARLVALQPRPEWRLELAVVRGRLGDMQWSRGNFTGAIVEYTASLQLRQDVAATKSPDISLKGDLASSHYFLGQTYLRIDDEAAAAGHFEEAAKMYEEVVRDEPSNRGASRNLAVTAMKLGDLARARAALPAAIASHQRSIAVLEKTLSADRANTDLRRVLAFARLRLAEDYLAASNHTDALRESQLALALTESLAAADPRNAQARDSTAYAQRIVAESLAGLNRHAEALAALARVRTILDTPPGRRDNADALRELSLAWGNEGDVLRAMNNPAAVAAYRRGLEVTALPALRSDQPLETVSLLERAGDAERAFAGRAGDSAVHESNAACDHYRQALETARRLPATNTRASAAIDRLGKKIDRCPAR